MSPRTMLYLVLLVLPVAHSRRLNNQTICLSQPGFVCVLTPTPGNTASGRVLITPHFSASHARRNCQPLIRARISGLSPGPHGFHIHTYGDASKADATSAGGHFTNSRGAELPHGYPGSSRRHWGDLGNLIVGKDGVGVYDRVDEVTRYRSVLGRSFVVHEGMDMGPLEQPSGAAGSRVASCVIGFANPEIEREF